jgi:hypothetical protein
LKTLSALTLLLLGPLAAIALAGPGAPEISLRTIIQITAEDDLSDDRGVVFGNQRVRLVTRAKSDRMYGKLQVDFDKADDGAPDPATMDAVVKDAEAGYVVDARTRISFGLFKTPLGMDFLSSGTNLDIIKRGMEKGLVIERAVGVMASVTLPEGLGVQAGVFNPATRSRAIDATSAAAPIAGEDYTFVGRGTWDRGPWHAEVAYGLAQSSAEVEGTTAEDYGVFDAGVRYQEGPVTAKAEFITGSGIENQDGRDQTVWYVHGGYMVTDWLEGVARYYGGRYERGDLEQDVGNLYLGANVFLTENRRNGRLQVNYVVSGGDAADWSGKGLVYADDAVLVHYQVMF